MGIQDSLSIQTEDGATGTGSSMSSDQIWKYKLGGGFDGAWLFDSGGSTPGYDNKWIDMTAPVSPTISWDVGESFFYYRQPGQGSFDWVVDRPFEVD